jgi:hypothetical protein
VADARGPPEEDSCPGQWEKTRKAASRLSSVEAPEHAGRGADDSETFGRGVFFLESSFITLSTGRSPLRPGRRGRRKARE